MHIIAVGVSTRPCVNKVLWRQWALFNLHRREKKIFHTSCMDKAIIPTYKPTNQSYGQGLAALVISCSTSNMCTQNTLHSRYTKLIMDFSSWLTALTWNTNSQSESKFIRTERYAYCIWNQWLLNVIEQKTRILWQKYNGYSVNHDNATCQSHVWLTMHHNSVWIRKTNQMSLFVFFISLLIVAQHVFANHVPIIRSWRLRDDILEEK